MFTAVANAIEWIVRHEGVEDVIHHLDKFLIISCLGCTECADALTKLMQAFECLVAHHKFEGPATRLSFLGIKLDTIAMQLCLPQRKLVELRALLTEWKG